MTAGEKCKDCGRAIWHARLDAYHGGGQIALNHLRVPGGRVDVDKGVAVFVMPGHDIEMYEPHKDTCEGKTS